jgi:hypothetical protein
MAPPVPCLLLLTLAAAAAACDADGPRLDCGFVGIDAAGCAARGCCWAPAATGVDLPWCFDEAGSDSSAYAVERLVRRPDGGLDADLSIARATRPDLGPDAPRLRVEATAAAPGTLRVRITDAARRRWEPPRALFRSGVLNTSAPTSYSPDELGIDVECPGPTDSPYATRQTFELTVRRRGGSSYYNELFSTSYKRLVFKEQYTELTTALDARATLFGGGERAGGGLALARDGVPRALWNRDCASSVTSQNLYSSWPLLIAVTADGRAHGYLILSSNAVDIVPAQSALSWRLTGGVVDLFVFAGPTPLDVLDQYARVVGRPAFPPRWALGWGQSRWGYASVAALEEVVARYDAEKIPLETVYSDIDHMDGYGEDTSSSECSR